MFEFSLKLRDKVFDNIPLKVLLIGISRSCPYITTNYRLHQFHTKTIIKLHKTPTIINLHSTSWNKTKFPANDLIDLLRKKTRMLSILPVRLHGNVWEQKLQSFGHQCCSACCASASYLTSPVFCMAYITRMLFCFSYSRKPTSSKLTFTFWILRYSWKYNRAIGPPIHLYNCPSCSVAY